MLHKPPWLATLTTFKKIQILKKSSPNYRPYHLPSVITKKVPTRNWKTMLKDRKFNIDFESHGRRWLVLVEGFNIGTYSRDSTEQVVSSRILSLLIFPYFVEILDINENFPCTTANQEISKCMYRFRRSK